VHGRRAGQCVEDGVVDHEWIGIQVELRVAGSQVRALSDRAVDPLTVPAISTVWCLAATRRFHYLAGWTRAETRLSAGHQMELLVAEIALLLTQAMSGVEYRG
jgi:hypothetical protein